MSEELIKQLLQTYGSLGAVLVVAGYALRALHRQLTEVQEKRIADAQAATAKLLELVQKQHEQHEQLARAIDGNADAVHALRTSIESVAAERGYHQRMPPLPRRS
jgi:hypothetical protein